MSERRTLARLVDTVARLLDAAGIDEPRAEARLIVAHATGLDRARQLLDPGEEVDPELALSLARRRVAREPMAYLRGFRTFWDQDYLVGPGVLIPRPETETLIEAVLGALPDRGASLRILDLGTGSGCLLLTLLSLYPKAIGIGIDRSAASLAWAARNRQRFSLERRSLLVRGDWLDAVAGPFDLVVANPPYIAPGEPRDPETRHEPEAALVGGVDGLDAYRAIAARAPSVLGPDGRLVLEIGSSQAACVAAIMERSGLAVVDRRADLAGLPRVIMASPTIERRAGAAVAPRR